MDMIDLPILLMKKAVKVRLRFGSLVLTPDNKKRGIYQGNDIANEHVKLIIKIIG